VFKPIFFSKVTPFISVILLTSVSHASFAAGNAHARGWWLSLEYGLAAPIASQHTTTEAMPLDPDPESTNYYYDNYITNKRGTTMSIALGGGYQFMLRESLNGGVQWLPSYRLGAFYNNYLNSTVKGNMLQHQTTPFFNYAYKVNSQVLWLDAQLDLLSWRKFTPFFEVGVGPSLNATNGYNEDYFTPTISQSANFKAKSAVNFAWRLGLGVNYNLPWQNHAMNVGFVYRYADLGNAKTGTADQDTYPTMKEVLNIPLKNNEFMLNFSYHI
jgi:opacity protein-like surface antigen